MKSQFQNIILCNNKFGCIAGFCILSSYGMALSSQNQHMNVLFIAVDDLNDYVGFLGGYPQSWNSQFAVTDSVEILDRKG